MNSIYEFFDLRIYFFLDANIAQILPVGAAVHEELFEPCGYSMNALMPNSVSYQL